MGLAAPLLAIILAGAQSPPASPPASSQAAPAPPASGGSDAREHGPAKLAAVTFAFACLQRVDDAPGEFSKRSEGLGAEFGKDHPAEAAFVTLDGDGGQGCRVRLHGPDAQTMWNAWRSVPSIFGPGAGTGCVPLETADLRVRARCDSAATPARQWEIAVERTSTGADATVSAIVPTSPAVTDIALNAGGLIGVGLVLLAYAGIQFDWFDPKKAPALLMNLVGSGLILLSMVRAFNLSAFLMEAAWAAMAAFGLVRLATRRR